MPSPGTGTKFRCRFNRHWVTEACEIWANEIELERYETLVEGKFFHGQRLWDFIDPIYTPDVYYPETVLLVREAGGVLIVGDMLSGGRKDLGIVNGDVGIMGPEYIADLERARRSLSELLNYSHTLMCF